MIRTGNDDETGRTVAALKAHSTTASATTMEPDKWPQQPDETTPQDRPKIGLQDVQTEDRVAEFERLLAAALHRILAPTDPTTQATADAPAQTSATTAKEETRV